MFQSNIAQSDGPLFSFSPKLKILRGMLGTLQTIYPYGWSAIPYSGKLLREKNFVNFTALWLFTKVFSAKFGGLVSFGAAKVSNPRKFSLYFSLIHKSFHFQKFLTIRYIFEHKMYLALLKLL